MDELGTDGAPDATSQTRLQLADNALKVGQFDDALALADVALAEAYAANDLQTQAQALSLLGDRHRLLSEYRRALDTSQRSAHLFRLVGDVRGEVIALTIVAHAASNLGRNEDAVEAALLSVRLGALMLSGREQAMSYNYLGVAYLWSRNWKDAQLAFDAAVLATEQCAPIASPAQPLLNKFLTEILRHSARRFHEGRTVSVGCQVALAEQVAMALELKAGSTLNETAQKTLDCLSRFGLSIVYSWLGEVDKAARELEASGAFLGSDDKRTWLNAFHAWAQAELLWQCDNLPAAEKMAEKMVQLATEVEHEQLACVGQLLRCQIAADDGRHADALETLRTLMHRERSIRAESIQSRERAVQWQLDVRNGETSIRSLQSDSRRLEKLSLEDELTGLANRRCFELRVRSMLESQAANLPPLSVALIDVDQFKHVNDSFSHEVGDAVLKEISGILCASIREDDLAARLAGDEFVIAFGRMNSSLAIQVCERICSSVEAFDWSSIAPGLHTSISFGVSEAIAGDTAATLLHRSDIAMYAFKKAEFASRAIAPRVA